jgi:hypothetical protein
MFQGICNSCVSVARRCSDALARHARDPDPHTALLDVITYGAAVSRHSGLTWGVLQPGRAAEQGRQPAEPGRQGLAVCQHQARRRCVPRVLAEGREG